MGKVFPNHKLTDQRGSITSKKDKQRKPHLEI